MTNAEAIEILTQRKWCGECCMDCSCKECDMAFDMAIKALEQEPVIDKIRAEIEARLCDVVSNYTDGYRTAIQGALAILDKYKAESEGKNE